MTELDRLAVTEHDITFRYVPAGTFLMGSEHGDPDEGPVHPVRLDEYWLAETPVSWAAFCDLMNSVPPPQVSSLEDRVRLQYCENATTRAIDWHAHVPDLRLRRGDGQEVDPGRCSAGRPGPIPGCHGGMTASRWSV